LAQAILAQVLKHRCEFSTGCISKRFRSGAMIVCLLISIAMTRYGLPIWKERRPQVLGVVQQHEGRLNDWGIRSDQVLDEADAAIHTFHSTTISGAVLVIGILVYAVAVALGLADVQGQLTAPMLLLLALAGDLSIGLQGNVDAAKAKLVKGLKNLVADGSWTGWFAVKIFPVEFFLNFADLLVDGTPDHVIHLAQWLLNENAPASEGVGICIELCQDAFVDGYSCGCCGTTCWKSDDGQGTQLVGS